MASRPRTRPVSFTARALRDLRRIGPGPEAQRIRATLEALARGEDNLDVRALEGSPGWLRLRVGDWRVLYTADERGWRVERIVSRGDLKRAVASLRL